MALRHSGHSQNLTTGGEKALSELRVQLLVLQVKGESLNERVEEVTVDGYVDLVGEVTGLFNEANRWGLLHKNYLGELFSSVVASLDSLDVAVMEKASDLELPAVKLADNAVIIMSNYLKRVN